MSQYLQTVTTLAVNYGELAQKVTAIQETVSRLNGSNPGVNSEWVNKKDLTVLTSKVADLDASVAALSSELTRMIVAVKEDSQKERGLIETALQLKLEHYITKCVKERLELGIHTLKAEINEQMTTLKSNINVLSEDISNSKKTAETSQTSQISQTLPTPSLSPMDNVMFETSNIDLDNLTINSSSTVDNNNEDPIDFQIRKKIVKKSK
jgi:uncharacterized small protein (DUF1192 family)